MARGQGKHTLYFIIRSWLMSNINAVLLLSIVFVLGSINFWQTIVIGVVLFIVSLAISRLFETQMEHATKKIMKYLDKHKKIKNLILKNF